MTQAFQWLLKKCAFPYKEYDERNPQDAMLLKQLKEDFCHVNLVNKCINSYFFSIESISICFYFIQQDICGPTEKEFVVDHNNRTKSKYTLQVGDECLVAPLSLFHTELLNITGPGKLARVQKPARQQPDPEDCFDAEYLRETGVSTLSLQISSMI